MLLDIRHIPCILRENANTGAHSTRSVGEGEGRTYEIGIFKTLLDFFGEYHIGQQGHITYPKLVY